MVATRRISIRTKGNGDIVDITRRVAEVVAGARLKDGTATVFVTHSTAAVTTIECEPGLIRDFKAFFDRIVPDGIAYEHDRGSGEGNGHAHVRASLLGPSLTVPFSNVELELGTWQQIILIDFDNRPRDREVIVKIVGE